MSQILSARYLVVALLLALSLFAALRALRPAGPGRIAPGAAFLHRNGWPIGLFLVGAVLFWAVVLILAPQIFMLDLSFRFNLPRAQIGGPQDVATLRNYGFGGGMSMLHLKALGTTLAGSAIVTVLCLLLCYPVAFHLAQYARERGLQLALALLLVPYWVNELLRAFAFRIIFTEQGLLNRLLLDWGLIGAPLDFFNAEVPLYAGLVYAYLLFMFFPLYNALRGLPHEQIEAARDLGAPWWHIHAFLVLPGIRTGISAGCTMVFMICAGSLAIPQVLGGTRTLWFAPIIYDRFFESFDWPQGSAYAVSLLVSCTAVVMVLQRLFGVGMREVSK
ncbi:MAG: ABC transporter permease [Paracoccus aminovorans]|nr:ABC transporter permease [Paracoccus aminovorans]